MAADEHTLLSTNPVVQIESITLHHQEKNYLHLRPVEHNNCVSNFLYTHNEIKRFSNLIHFAQVKKQVLNNLVTDFCKNNPTCGGYQPAVEPVVPLNLAAINDEISSPWTWVNSIKHILIKIGSICSICIVAVI